MWIESQDEYECIINTYNIKGIGTSESSYGYGLYSDHYKLCEYKSKEIRDEIFCKLKDLIIENKLVSYKLPEECEFDK